MAKIVYKGGSSTRKAAAGKQKAPAVDITMPDAPMGLINGQQPQSSYEWNMARAMWALGWSFDYQVRVFGGWDERGGQSLDFLVHTAPNYTPVPVDGGYWHRADETSFKDSELMRGLSYRGHPVNQPIHALDKDAATYEDALRFVSTNFGRG